MYYTAMAFFVIAIIAVVSIALAYRTLKNLSKVEEIGKAKRELKKGRVIFQRGSSR